MSLEPHPHLSSLWFVLRYLSEVLPALNSNGDLPPGIHRANWNEVEQRFGSGSKARTVDVVLIMTRDFRIEDCSSESRALFSHLQAEARYGASVFWAREGTLPRDFMQAWQVKRDGSLRGILEVG
ncbi:MAG TPA: hypothetical protein VEU32_08510 [Burkholderiales bacterium]|nr:hypothetical protein [Burkholderiales bacterium]